MPWPSVKEIHLLILKHLPEVRGLLKLPRGTEALVGAVWAFTLYVASTAPVNATFAVSLHLARPACPAPQLDPTKPALPGVPQKAITQRTS